MLIRKFIKKMGGIAKYLTIFLVIMSWVFSSWLPFDIGFEVEKAQGAATAGDYLIMRNNADTTAITTSNLDATWDTQVSSNGSSISYSAGTFTLAAGKYLVMYSERFNSSDSSDNLRVEIQSRLVVGGTATTTAAGQAYMRKRDSSTGDWQDNGVVHGAGILHIQNNDTSLVTRFYRQDTASGTNNRYPGWGGVTILALDDTWNYARYVTDSDKTANASQSVWADIVWDTNLEQDSGFSRSGADITITSAGRYIVTASVPIYSSGTNDRHEWGARLTLNNTQIEGTDISTYIRGYGGVNYGMFTYVGIIDVGATDVLALEHIRREGSNGNYLTGSNIEIVQLPAGNETIIVEATTGEMNPSSLTEFTWDTTAHIDTAGFTMAAGTQSYFDVDVSDDYLLFATHKTNNGNTRSYPSGRFSVDDVILSYAAGAEYNRNSGTADQAGYSFGTLATGVAAGADISLENFPLAQNVGTQTVNHGAMSALRWGSVFTSTNPKTEQLHFRWRDDTTALNTGGGWLAVEDSNGIADVTADTTYRLRVEIANTGASAEAASRTYELQYGVKSGTCGGVSTWVGVGNTADAFDMVGSVHITSDGQATTALLGNTETYTFVAGEGRDIADTTGSIGPMTNSYYTEIEYSFKPTTSVAYGTTYCFRLYDTTADSVLNVYSKYPEVTSDAGDPVFRSTEYYLTTGDFTGTTYDLTLDQALEANHFILIKGSKVDNGGSNPDNDYVRVYELPSAISGELPDSGSTSVVALSRHVADYTWEGVVTVVECLQECTTNGFTTLGIVETALGNTVTSGTDTSGTTWSDINDVVLFGGFWGGGAEFEADAASTGLGNAVQTRLYPSATDTLNWTRESTESLLAATMTTFVVEWGSNWTVQHANVSGSTVGAGCDSTNEYNTGAINSVARDNTWIWATGIGTMNGIGDSFSGTLVTLGDGVNQNTNETLVSFCGEYASTKNADIYTMTHSSLAVDYRKKVDGDSASNDLAVTVDAATNGTRMAMVHNGCNGSGSAHPRDRFWARYTADDEVTVSRGYNGQDFPAWIQGIEFVGIQATPVSVSISLNTNGSVGFGLLSLNATEDTSGTGINDIEVISVDNGPADLDVRSSTFTEGGNTWTLGATNGANQTRWDFTSTTAWTNFAIADTLYSLQNSVAEGQTRNLILRIQMPTATDSFDQYSGTVTVVASAP